MLFRVMTSEDLAYMQKHGGQEKDRKIRAGESEYNYALVDGEVTLGIAGFRFINDTTAWCWLCMGEAATQHLTESFRCLATWIPSFCHDFGVRRLEAYVEVGFEEGIRLVEHLQFEEESRMKDFMGKGKPGIRFVRFFEESK